jgi:hypothetical protein
MAKRKRLPGMDAKTWAIKKMCDENRRYKLSDKELATVLAALRHFFFSFKEDSDVPPKAIYSEFADVEPLTGKQINDLYGRLNCGG